VCGGWFGGSLWVALPRDCWDEIVGAALYPAVKVRNQYGAIATVVHLGSLDRCVDRPRRGLRVKYFENFPT
jgi:hypothetical protein